MSNIEAKKPTFSMMISSGAYSRLINRSLGDPVRAQRFVTALTSAVSCNPELQKCDVATIISAGLLGESLQLSPSPQLGQYYLVPFNDRKNGRTVATFQLGYKGYTQLAIRSGQYKKLNVLPIKKGELISYNPLEEEINVELIQDENEREAAETVGYYAMFEYINGFRKTLYWTKEKMESHALKYSSGYKVKKGYTFWEKDFDSMACKTMLRQLISKWGIMSIELQNAFISDNAVIGEDGSATYIEDEGSEIIIQNDEPSEADEISNISLDEV